MNKVCGQTIIYFYLTTDDQQEILEAINKHKSDNLHFSTLRDILYNKLNKKFIRRKSIYFTIIQFEFLEYLSVYLNNKLKERIINKYRYFLETHKEGK